MVTWTLVVTKWKVMEMITLLLKNSGQSVGNQLEAGGSE